MVNCHAYSKSYFEMFFYHLLYFLQSDVYRFCVGIIVPFYSSPTKKNLSWREKNLKLTSTYSFQHNGFPTESCFSLSDQAVDVYLQQNKLLHSHCTWQTD